MQTHTYLIKISEQQRAFIQQALQHYLTSSYKTDPNFNDPTEIIILKDMITTLPADQQKDPHYEIHSFVD